MVRKKLTALVPFLLIALCIASVLIVAFEVQSTVVSASVSDHFPLIILDPGHGGIDGGAVSADGLLEKDVNLAVALNLRDLLRAAGYSVVMTRETDCSIHDADASTIRQIKVSDIHNRLKIMNEHPGSVFISIHQNHFTESKYWGAQFFYSTAVGTGKALAEQFQLAFCALLQPENKREIKASGSDIYLMHHAGTTAVLAECGFLSNPDEAAKLSAAEYQKKVAFVLFCGLSNYIAQD